MQKLLEVKNLKTYFVSNQKTVPAVDGVSFGINEGETLCVVGESGCGKSVTALSIMRLISTPPGRFVDGQVLFRGEDLLAKPESQMRQIRGNEISMIYQEPMTSLNPVFTVGSQIAEAIRQHLKLNKKEAMEKAEHMLKMVGIPDPHKRVREYPHQLSGGMRQRVMIALGLSCNPRLLIADEPTTALDVTIQAQILELMAELKKEFGMAIMFITHDLGVVAEIAERVVVMYAGKVVEEANTLDIFTRPLHPYTEGLLDCIPKISGTKGKLRVIKGTVANPTNFPSGCRFHPRCSYAQSICRVNEPALKVYDDAERKIACHFKPEERALAEVVN
ncbi:MAG: ABC transporter ATP-binding protein [Firmicutes bacterium]|nr:ABC transporter ATP-binding protein [Bacillota bacterium]